MVVFKNKTLKKALKTRGSPIYISVNDRRQSSAIKNMYNIHVRGIGMVHVLLDFIYATTRYLISVG